MVCISSIILHSNMLQTHGGPLCAASMYGCNRMKGRVRETKGAREGKKIKAKEKLVNDLVEKYNFAARI